MIFLHSFNTFEVNLLKNERQMSNFLVLFFYLQKIIHGAKLKQNLLRQLLNSRGDHCVLSFENCILCRGVLGKLEALSQSHHEVPTVATLWCFSKFSLCPVLCTFV